MDRHDESLAALEQAFSQTPDHLGLKAQLAAALAESGLACLNGQDFGPAMDRLGRANALFPEDGSIRQNLLVAYVRGGEDRYQNGRNDEAESAFERALTLAPDHPAVRTIVASHHYRHALDLTQRDDAPAALVKLDRAVAIAPDIGDAFSYLERIVATAIGQPGCEQSFINRVLIHFRTVAHNLDRVDDFISFLKSVLFDSQGAGDAALLSCWCTVAGRELMRSDGYFHYHYGADAIDFLRRAIALSPANTDAFRFLGMCQIRSNDYESAIESFKISLALNADQLDPFYSNEAGMGLAYYHGGYPEQAARTYQTLLDRFEPYPATYEYVRCEVARLLAWTQRQPAPPRDEFHFRLAHYADDKRGWYRPAGRKPTVRILCFGKCNAQAIVSFLHPALAEHADLRIIPVWSEDAHRAKHDIVQYTEQSDVVIFQDFAIVASADNSILINNQDILAAEMEKNPHLVKIIYPYIENPAMWSIFIRTGDQMPVTSKAVRELLESDRPIDEILRAYDAGQLDFDFTKRSKDTMSSLKFMERSTDIKVHDYIQANMKRSQLFLDPNHPGKDIWIEVTRQICAILVERNVIPAAPSDLPPLYAHWSNEVPYEGVATPIDRYSQAHFAFDWGPMADSPGLAAYYHRMLRYGKARLAG